MSSPSLPAGAVPDADGAPASTEPAVDELTQAVEALMARLDGFGHYSMEELDGYATGMACHPRPPPAEVWTAWLFGDAFERCFADPQDAASAHATLNRWLARIGEDLEPKRLLEFADGIFIHPYVMEWDDADRAAFRASNAQYKAESEAAGRPLDADPIEAERWIPFTGAVWASACLQGVEAAIANDPLPVSRRVQQAQEDAIAAIGALTLGDSGPEWQSHLRRLGLPKTPSRAHLLDRALQAVQDLRLMWLDAALTPQPAVAEPKIGRNDPCHCGSGRKFKKCHGAASA